MQDLEDLKSKLSEEDQKKIEKIQDDLFGVVKDKISEEERAYKKIIKQRSRDLFKKGKRK